MAEYTIRAFTPADAEAIAALTLAAIRQTALRAYSPEQVAAWSARYSPARLLESAARGDVILVAADADDRPAAYTVLEADGHLDMLFCHPDHTGHGLGLRLLNEAEEAARPLGAERLYTEASELARSVFARAGYALLHRRDFTIPFEGSEVAIHNYAMEKRLG
jgi:putative acetyltransferase